MPKRKRSREEEKAIFAKKGKEYRKDYRVYNRESVVEQKKSLTEIPKAITGKLPEKLVTMGFIIGAIQFAPMARELYIGYKTAHLLYASRNIVYNAYKNSETLKQEAYSVTRDEVKAGLTSHQTGIIWNNIEEKVPGPIKHEAHEYLTNLMSNITEEEISLVENALIAF